jgi:hypothetical protein
MHIKRIENLETQSAVSQCLSGLETNSFDTMWQPVILVLFLLRRNPPNAAGVHAMWRRTKGKRGRHTLHSFRSVRSVETPPPLS